MPSDAIWSAIARPDAIVSSETLTSSAKTLFTTEYSTPRITQLTESVIASKLQSEPVHAPARASAVSAFGCDHYDERRDQYNNNKDNSRATSNNAVLQILGRKCQGAANNQSYSFSLITANAA